MREGAMLRLPAMASGEGDDVEWEDADLDTNGACNLSVAYGGTFTLGKNGEKLKGYHGGSVRKWVVHRDAYDIADLRTQAAAKCKWSADIVVKFWWWVDADKIWIEVDCNKALYRVFKENMDRRSVVLCVELVNGENFGVEPTLQSDPFFNATEKGNMQFPGLHPVSLDSDNLKLLRQKHYYATWKPDGTRYMMLIMRFGCFLVDRNFCFRRIQLRFPLRNINEGFHDGTLIDGETVISEVPASVYRRTYFAYDLMALNGSSKVNLPFSERRKLLREEIIRPRFLEWMQFEKEGHYKYRYDKELFEVRRKSFWPLSTVRKLLIDFIKNLYHRVDGLIFQGWDDPYLLGTHEGLLEWKHPKMNTVDFLLEIESENRHLLFLYERGKKKLIDYRVLGGEYDLSTMSGKIIECFFNSKEDSWQVMRIRMDKNTPNDFNTYRKVMQTAKSAVNMTLDVLLSAIDEIISLPMYMQDPKPPGRRFSKTLSLPGADSTPTQVGENDGVPFVS